MTTQRVNSIYGSHDSASSPNPFTICPQLKFSWCFAAGVKWHLLLININSWRKKIIIQKLVNIYAIYTYLTVVLILIVIFMMFWSLYFLVFFRYLLLYSVTFREFRMKPFIHSTGIDSFYCPWLWIYFISYASKFPEAYWRRPESTAAETLWI